MSKCTTLSFIGQAIFCGFDVHKKLWSVCVRHCGREIASFSTAANAGDVAKKLRNDYPGADIHSVYEAGFSGFEAHRVLADEFGIHNIVVNPADVPTKILNGNAIAVRRGRRFAVSRSINPWKKVPRT